MPKPIATLARLAVALDELGIRYLREGPAGMTGLCMNIAALHGGMAFNVVPQRGRLEWSTRPYPSFDRAAYTAELAKLVKATSFQVMECLGHFPMSENPAQFRKYLLPVLERI